MDVEVARLPKVHALYIDVACSGPLDSTMKWALQTAQGASFGPSASAPCNGATSGAGVGLQGIRLPKGIQVHIDPGTDVSTAYAVVRRRAD